MSVKLVYRDVAVGAAEDATVVSSTAFAGSDVSLLPVGVDTTALATCEPNCWLLDGSYQLKAGQAIGFWSEDMSDDGRSSTATITVTFTQQFTSLGIFLKFDTSTGNYCDQVQITWYQGETQLDQKIFYPTGASYFCTNTVTAYNKVVIELQQSSLPQRRARLSQIMFGVIREFGVDELRSVTVQQEIDPISSDLPISTLDWTLDSKDDIDFLFQLKQPVSAYDGDTLIGVYYVDSSKRLSDSLYSISCEDALGILDDTDFSAAIYSGTNAKTLITEILDGNFTLEMDAALESETVTGYIPDCSCREALQQIAFAIGAVIDTAGSDAVVVSALPSSGAAVIPKERTYTGGEVETAALVTAVKVTAHTYTAGSGSSGDDVITVNGTKYVHTTAITTITNPLVTASDKPNVVEVKEATLVNSSNVAAVAQRVYDDACRREQHSVKFVLSGEQPGDYVTTQTPYSSTITGNITSMAISLSGIAAADAEIKGA